MAYLSKFDQVRSNTPHRTKSGKKQKVKTPIPVGEKKCYNCKEKKYLEIHHVFYNSKRNDASIHKCTEWLCWTCHRNQPFGVHVGNESLDNRLKVKHQTRLEEEGMTRKEFIEIFGRNYKED